MKRLMAVKAKDRLAVVFDRIGGVTRSEIEYLAVDDGWRFTSFSPREIVFVAFITEDGVDQWLHDGRVGPVFEECSACGHPGERHVPDCVADVMMEADPPFHLQCLCDGRSGLVYVTKDERIPESDPRFPWRRVDG